MGDSMWPIITLLAVAVVGTAPPRPVRPSGWPRDPSLL